VFELTQGSLERYLDDGSAFCSFVIVHLQAMYIPSKEYFLLAELTLLDLGVCNARFIAWFTFGGEKFSLEK
jgi:hypothetical protein